MKQTRQHSDPLTDATFDAPSLAETLGRNVKALRKDERITKTRFAAMVGIGRPLLNKIENGTANVRLSLVEELAVNRACKVVRLFLDSCLCISSFAELAVFAFL